MTNENINFVPEQNFPNRLACTKNFCSVSKNVVVSQNIAIFGCLIRIFVVFII